jgi:uncharacterized protein YbjT (DUF2867 family)
VAVIGASGFVGRQLALRLAGDGTAVIAVGRRPDRLPIGPTIEHRTADIGDPEAATAAVKGADIAYYLVHALAGGDGFAQQDRDTARAFVDGARRAGVRRIVYLGGLGRDDASAHLHSRHEVGRILAESGIPVVELRAAIVIGSGGISFEMLRYLTERLPAMVCPRWIDTRIQPVAESDLLDLLVRAPSAVPGIYEVGSTDVTTYRHMIQTYARVRGLRRRRIVRVPLLTPRLSARWVDLVTPVDRRVSHSLLESLRTEVVVGSGADASTLGVEPMPVADAIAVALDGQHLDVTDELWTRPSGLVNGVYTMRTEALLGTLEDGDVAEDLAGVGGDLGWYGVSWAWRMRVWLGYLLNERLVVHRPEAMAPGARVDWWTVVAADGRSLVLTAPWKIGDAWLAYRVSGGGAEGPTRPRRLEQVAVFRPRGLPGLLYWRILWPVHRIVFSGMVRHRVRAMRRSRRRRERD